MIRRELYQGNTQYITFVLRQYAQKAAWDVSFATVIYLRVTTEAGVTTTLNCADDDPGADWAHGIVTVRVGPADTTATAGTKRYTLSVQIEGQDLTPESGVFEVLPRPT